VYVFQTIHSFVGSLSTEYFKTQLADYLKHMRLSQKMAEFQQGIRDGKGADGFINQVTQLNKTLSLNNEIVIDNAYYNPEPMLELKQFNRISTGLQGLNSRLSGGLGEGELGMITACPGVGKTTSLLNFQEGAIVAGWLTCFISLEMQIRRIKYRYQGIAAGIDAHYFKLPMKDWPEEQLKRWNAVINPNYRFYGAATMIDMSVGKHKPAALDEAISRWMDAVDRDGRDVTKCKGVYVDWLDMLDPRGIGLSKDDKAHDLLKELCYELGRIARKHKVALWTATQGTREADGREILSMKHVSGAYHKNDALDVGLGLGVINDPSNVQRNDDVGAIPSDDDSIDDPTQGAIPCNRRLMLNLMKNRDNSPSAFEIFQGPTLKLWARSADATADADLLLKGKFDERTDKLQKQGKKKYLGN